MRENIINAILLMFLATAVLIAAEQKAALELPKVASVGPLLDSMAAICGEAFDVKRHKLTLDDKDNVTGCEVKP